MVLSNKHFLQGALILTIAALISKILGAIYRIPLQQLTGDSGLAIYGAVYPVYSTIMLLVVAGIPVALSKMIAEQVAVGNVAEEKRILRLSLQFIGFLGVLSFLVLFFGAGIIARWMGMEEAKLAIQAVSFTLLIIPLLAVLRGFFYGHQHIAPSAVSQVIEQFFRVMMIITLTYILVIADYSLEVTIAGATFATVVGVFISVLYLVYKYIQFQKNRIQSIEVKPQGSLKNQKVLSQYELLKKICFFTVAISVSSLILPLFGLSDTFTAIHLLEEATGSYDEAKDWFGVYNRFLPFVQLTTIFATSLALSLIPKISESDVRRNDRELSHSAYLAIKITVLLAMPASIGLAMLADEINILFYQDSLGSFAFAVVSLASFFLTLGITVIAVLQGMGKIFFPAAILLLSIVVKLALNALLIPQLSITGMAISTLCAFFLLFVINGFVMAKKLPIFAGWVNIFARPLLASLIMGIFVFLSEKSLRHFYPSPSRLESGLFLVILIGIGLIVYGISILLLKGITKHELMRIPKYGNMIVGMLERLHLLKV